MNRRKFLKLLGVGALSLVLPVIPTIDANPVFTTSFLSDGPTTTTSNSNNSSTEQVRYTTSTTEPPPNFDPGELRFYRTKERFDGL